MNVFKGVDYFPVCMTDSKIYLKKKGCFYFKNTLSRMHKTKFMYYLMIVYK